MAKKEKSEVEKTNDINKLRAMINKKAGFEASFALDEGDDRVTVKQWIPTGSRLLDGIICQGKIFGIPVGRISEIASLAAVGKSYMAIQIAKNALDMGIIPVLFDSESALSREFVTAIGMDINKLIYIQAVTAEFVLETIEDMMKNSDQQFLFILDSLAMVSTENDIGGDYNPQSSLAYKARVFSRGLPKLIIPLSNHQSTFLVLNQLKVNLAMNSANPTIERMTTPFVTPGGSALTYGYSLRIWLKSRKAKDSFIYNDLGEVIGTEIKAEIEKSRFGSYKKSCVFKILWRGEKVSIQDKESWIPVLRKCPKIKTAGAWSTLTYEDGTEEKFSSNSFMEKMNNPKFESKIIEILDDYLINSSGVISDDDDDDETVKQ